MFAFGRNTPMLFLFLLSSLPVMSRRDGTKKNSVRFAYVIRLEEAVLPSDGPPSSRKRLRYWEHSKCMPVEIVGRKSGLYLVHSWRRQCRGGLSYVSHSMVVKVEPVRAFLSSITNRSWLKATSITYLYPYQTKGLLFGDIDLVRCSTDRRLGGFEVCLTPRVAFSIPARGRRALPLHDRTRDRACQKVQLRGKYESCSCMVRYRRQAG